MDIVKNLFLFTTEDKPYHIFKIKAGSEKETRCSKSTLNFRVEKWGYKWFGKTFLFFFMKNH